MTKFDFKSFYQNNIKSNLKDGINQWNYYLLYSKIYLNHKVTKAVDNAMINGVGSVGAVLAWYFESPLIGVLATVLVTQWKIWQVPSYDNGNGIELIMWGSIPSAILYIYSQ